MAVERFPTLVVIVVEFVGNGRRPFGDRQTVTSLEHESHSSIGDAVRFQLAVRSGFETTRIRPVRRHNGMQRCSARMKTFLLSFVPSLNEAHELAHAIP